MPKAKPAAAPEPNIHHLGLAHGAFLAQIHGIAANFDAANPEAREKILAAVTKIHTDQLEQAVYEKSGRDYFDIPLNMWTICLTPEIYQAGMERAKHVLSMEHRDTASSEGMSVYGKIVQRGSSVYIESMNYGILVALYGSPTYEYNRRTNTKIETYRVFLTDMGNKLGNGAYSRMDNATVRSSEAAKASLRRLIKEFYQADLVDNVPVNPATAKTRRKNANTSPNARHPGVG